MTLLETARYWVEQGASVIPILYRSKRPMIRSWEPFISRLPTNQELLQWFPSEMRNIALITGNGIVVIDFDVMDAFRYWYSLFPIHTYMIKTSRGMHVYFNFEAPVKNYHSELLDIKGERGYVLIPPSIHPSGYQYQVYIDAPIYKTARLEDVLPKSFTPEPEKIAPHPTKPVTSAADPWAIADSAVDLDSNVCQVIRERISILSIIGAAEPSSSDGRWYVALCPFHTDHRPSFWIDTQRKICGCQKCRIKEMDVINLFGRLNNISNYDAIREMSMMLGKAFSGRL